MARTDGSYTYREDIENEILDFIDFTPTSTKAITEKLRMEFINKISQPTVLRLLKNLHKKGEIRCIELGQKHKIRFWNK